MLRLPQLILYILIIAPFFIVVNLYDIEDDLFYYPLRISVLFILIYEVYTAYKSYVLYVKTKLLLNQNNLDCSELIPKNGFDGLMYTNLINKNSREYFCEIKKYQSYSSNTLEYFQLWAHQIKTPLFALRLLMNSEKNLDKDSALIQISSIENYVDMAIKYLEIGDFNRDLRIENVNLDKAIKSALKPFSRAFAVKKIKLDYCNINELIVSDLKWLEFSIAQIISNSVKYSEENSTISIKLCKLNPIIKDGVSCYTACLEISDNGVGILPEDLPRIFEKGFTGKNGRNISNSTGIGLYVCKKILDKLGHKISVISDYGKGTTVKIFFIE